MDSIEYCRASLSMIAFFEKGEDDTIMQLDAHWGDDSALRVPNIGEHIILASYKHDKVNDDESVFRNLYTVIDVITHYSENRAYKNISVQYSVILEKYKG